MTKTTKGNASAEKLTSALIVLGYDDQQKPRGARFVDANPTLVAKAAELMDLNVYQAANGELADLAKKLPVGRLYSTGKGFVPNIRQSLYSQIIAALAGAPDAARGKDEDLPPVISGLPKTWDELGTGHLVIAQESHENGWWEAVCIKRDGDMLTLRFRDYPKLPKFSRHKTAVALICPEPG
jgi:TPR repeat protein